MHKELRALLVLLVVALFAFATFDNLVFGQSVGPVRYLSAIDPNTEDPILLPDPIKDPICTWWHEIYPTYCTEWHLTSWLDNGDGVLSISDIIDMTTNEGERTWFHVDRVTITIHWKWKELTPPGFDADELVLAEPEEDLFAPIKEPICTYWHIIYPREQFCTPFHITSWEDTDLSGDFNPCDQFDLDLDGTVYWAHLEAISTDIILTEIPPPTPHAYVDIKPGSWPNPINKRSKGKLPVAVCGTEDFDVKTIDPATIELTIEEAGVGVSPLRWSYEDVATPYTGEPGGGHALGGDGILDLVLHFKTQEVVDTLELCEYSRGEIIKLIIAGNLQEEYDGAAFQGQDYVRINTKQK